MYHIFLHCIFFLGSDNTILSKYLMKTVCLDLANIVIAYVAEDYGFECNDQDLSTNKVRQLA